MIKKYYLKKNSNLDIQFLINKNIIYLLNKELYLENFIKIKVFLKTINANIIKKKKFFLQKKYKRVLKSLILRNLIFVYRGFCAIIEVFGIGFNITMDIQKKILRLNIGYNHSIFYKIPIEIKIITKKRIFFIFSYSYFILKNIIKELKNFRRLSVYKLKGIKDKNELYIKKN